MKGQFSVMHRMFCSSTDIGKSVYVAGDSGPCKSMVPVISSVARDMAGVPSLATVDQGKLSYRRVVEILILYLMFSTKLGSECVDHGKLSIQK